MLDNWQRIEKIVLWTGLSVNAFARGVGLKRAENLYQIKKGNYGISKELAELICARYPTISKSWLLTGEGEMFLEDGDSVAVSIPFYRVDVVKLMLGDKSFPPVAHFSIPHFAGCELAAINANDAMEPEIPYGAIVVLRKCDLDTLLPGAAYLVLSPTFNGIRSVRREPGSPLLRLVPGNYDKYDEIVMSSDSPTGLYKIAGHIVIK